MVVLLVRFPAPSLAVKSTVSGIEHVGHGHLATNFEADESNKQALQKACPQLVTCNNKTKN